MLISLYSRCTLYILLMSLDIGCSNMFILDSLVLIVIFTFFVSFYFPLQSKTDEDNGKIDILFWLLTGVQSQRIQDMGSICCFII